MERNYDYETRRKIERTLKEIDYLTKDYIENHSFSVSINDTKNDTEKIANAISIWALMAIVFTGIPQILLGYFSAGLSTIFISGIAYFISNHVSKEKMNTRDGILIRRQRLIDEMDKIVKDLETNNIKILIGKTLLDSSWKDTLNLSLEKWTDYRKEYDREYCPQLFDIEETNN